MTTPSENPDSQTIEHERGDGAGRYWLSVEGGEAELTYRLRGAAVMVIDHTFTPPQARGRNIALKLVERAVADARAQGLRIDPQCPYVAKLFQRRAEWASLRA